MTGVSSVHPSVRPSVRPSFCPSVRPSSVQPVRRNSRLQQPGKGNGEGHRPRLSFSTAPAGHPPIGGAAPCFSVGCARNDACGCRVLFFHICMSVPPALHLWPRLFPYLSDSIHDHGMTSLLLFARCPPLQCHVLTRKFQQESAPGRIG